MLEAIFKPHVLLMLPILISFAGWICPDFGVLRKGFEHTNIKTSLGVALYLTTILVFAQIARYVYNKTKSKFERGQKVGDRSVEYRTHMILSVVCFVGCFAVVCKLIEEADIANIYAYATSGQFNQIKNLLYMNYGIGVLSLRYAAILCFSITVARFLRADRMLPRDLWSIVAILFIASLSSRLSLVMGFMGGVYIFSKDSSRDGVHRLLVCIALIAASLFMFNWSRNKLTYATLNMGFIAAGISEIVSYLGTAFQGGVTYFSRFPNPLELDMFYTLSGIHPDFTTNGAVLELQARFGLIWIVVAFGTIAIASFFVAITECYFSGVFLLVNVSILYSIAEFWRVYMFNKGVVLACLIMALIPFVIQARSRLSRVRIENGERPIDVRDH